MSIVNHFWRIAINALPIILQAFIMLIPGKIFVWFQISNKAFTAIQYQGYAVLAVAWGADYFTVYSDPIKKTSAFLKADNRYLGETNRFIIQPFISFKNLV